MAAFFEPWLVISLAYNASNGRIPVPRDVGPLDEHSPRRSIALQEDVWRTLDNPCCPGPTARHASSDVAAGRAPAHLVIRDGRRVNVYSGEIVPHADVGFSAEFDADLTPTVHPGGLKANLTIPI